MITYTSFVKYKSNLRIIKQSDYNMQIKLIRIISYHKTKQYANNRFVPQYLREIKL